MQHVNSYVQTSGKTDFQKESEFYRKVENSFA
jgi:hypothetical protein